MAPCEFEIHVQEKWIKIGEVGPGDRPGSFSNVLPSRTRELYIFECAPDNSKTTIYKSGSGIDIELENLRAVIPDPTKFTVERELKPGDSYKKDITTTRGTQTKIRLTHK